MNANGEGDSLTQIWKILTTLTEEAMAAAAAKGEELGFDPNRGPVSLAESFINLSSARAVLEDGIEKQKLIQLPITVQKEILSNLESIGKSLQGLTNGVDEVQNLTAAIETLNTSIWKYGLHNLSDQVLGYQKKLNQLKNQEVQLSSALKRLKAAEDTAQKSEQAAGEIERTRTDAVTLIEQLKEDATSLASLLQEAKDSQAQASALLLTIQQNEKQSAELTSNVKTATTELVSLDTSIKGFYKEVDEYRRKINQTSDDASKLITTSEANLKKLAEEATSKVDGAIESLRKIASASGEELTKKVDAKIIEAGGSIAKLISDSQQKLTTLEEQLGKRSDETIGANQAKTDQLITELDKLKEQIREQIQQATGFRLFGAFQSRQNEIARAKKVWAYAIAALVLLIIFTTSWIAYEAQHYTVSSLAFWVKLSLTLPLAFAIYFCAVQYNRERRLEEEYAFKSSISVSLNPYRELVQSIVDKTGSADQSKYGDFVIASVTNVFTPPTDRVFETDKKSDLKMKAIKQAVEVVGAFTKAAK